jgi:hypothetical protein
MLTRPESPLSPGLLRLWEMREPENRLDYLREFRLYLIILLLAAALDFLSTWSFMSTGSPEDELHPVIRWVSMIAGPFVGPLIGKIGQIVALVILTVFFRAYARIIFVPVAMIYLYAAWYNTWGVDLYVPFWTRLLS